MKNSDPLEHGRRSLDSPRVPIFHLFCEREVEHHGRVPIIVLPYYHVPFGNVPVDQPTPKRLTTKREARVKLRFTLDYLIAERKEDTHNSPILSPIVRLFNIEFVTIHPFHILHQVSEANFIGLSQTQLRDL